LPRGIFSAAKVAGVEDAKAQPAKWDIAFQTTVESGSLFTIPFVGNEPQETVGGHLSPTSQRGREDWPIGKLGSGRQVVRHPLCLAAGAP
jgi:hypothetical protein